MRAPTGQLKPWLPALAALALAAPPGQCGFFGGDGGHGGWQRNQGGYFEAKERGWFWYEQEPEPEPEPGQEPAAPPPPPPPEPKQPPQETKPAATGPTPLSSAWLRQNMEKYRDLAVDQPTLDNVRAYYYLQRVMLDKAERFTQVSQRAMMTDPVLDEAARNPSANFASEAKYQEKAKNQRQLLKKLAGEAGIWFFYSSTCGFCEKQAPVLKWLENEYGFKVLPIALDGRPLPGGEYPKFVADHGQAAKLGVDTTPALFLVKPGAGAVGIGQGLLAGDQLTSRITELAMMNGWVGEAEHAAASPLGDDTLVSDGLGQGMGGNGGALAPEEVIKLIRQDLRRKR